MKRVDISIMIAAIMISIPNCVEKPKNVMLTEYGRATDDIYLEVRDGLSYQPNETEPYNGVITSYLEDGTKYTESEIIDGLPRFGTFYNLDGSIKHKAENVFDGKTRLKYITYYPEGVMKSSFDWVEDPVTGLKEHKEWYPNGQLKFVAPFKGSSYHGIMKYYDESGTLVSETMYEDGVPIES